MPIFVHVRAVIEQQMELLGASRENPRYPWENARDSIFSSLGYLFISGCPTALDKLGRSCKSCKTFRITCIWCYKVLWGG